MNNVTNTNILPVPTAKPEALGVDFNNIPLSLRDIPIFVMWKYVFKNDKWTKPPFQVNGAFAKTNDPLTWATYGSVKAAYEKGGFDGIGVMLRGDIVGIDLDHVITGLEVKPWALDVITQFKNTYIERSPSGDGLHILTTGSSRFTGKRGENNNLEVYDQTSPRYFTITGQIYSHGQTALNNSQDALDWLASKYDFKNLPSPQIEYKNDVNSIIKAIHNSKFKDKFDALNNGDVTGDHSADDLAFTNLIATFTEDITTINSIVRQSPFRMRDKWDEKHSADGKTYGEITIDKAIAAKAAIRAQNLLSSQNQSSATYFEEKNTTRFQLVSASELTVKQTHTEWLVKGLIGSNNMGLVFGQSGHGKSFFVLDMAFCIATGIDFFGHKVNQGSVVYIAGEGYSGLTKRLKALEIKYNRQAPKLFLSKTAAALTDVASSIEVRQAIDVICSDAALVIIDTLHRNFGAGDENSATDFGIFCNNVDSYIRKNGESVLIVHHSGHSDADRSRGSSSIKAAMDFEYRVTKLNNLLTVTNTKMKDDDPPEDLLFKMTQQPIGWLDEDGKEFTSLVLRETYEKINIRKQLTKTQKTGMESFKNAAKESYKDSGVHLDDWRPKFYEISTAENKEAKRQAFNRVRTSLVNKGCLSIANDFYDFAGEFATDRAFYRFRDKRDITVTNHAVADNLP